jgi:hypothetical protein
VSDARCVVLLAALAGEGRDRTMSTCVPVGTRKDVGLSTTPCRPLPCLTLLVRIQTDQRMDLALVDRYNLYPIGHVFDDRRRIHQPVGMPALDVPPLLTVRFEGAVLGWEVMNDIKMTAKVESCHAHQDTVRQVQGRTCGRSGAAVAQHSIV